MFCSDLPLCARVSHAAVLSARPPFLPPKQRRVVVRVESAGVYRPDDRRRRSHDRPAADVDRRRQGRTLKSALLVLVVVVRGVTAV